MAISDKGTAAMNLNARIYHTLVWFVALALLTAGCITIALRLRYIHLTAGDFYVDYDAARRLLNGESIYAPSEYPNYHPPFDAVLFLPVAMLPKEIALPVWSSFLLACLFALPWIIIRELKIELTLLQKVILIGALLCWYPVQAQIATGQLSILVNLLITATWVFLRRGRYWGAGVLLSLAIQVKLYPGLFLLTLLIQKRWKALITTSITFGLFSAFTVLLVGIPEMRTYIEEIAPQNATLFSGFPGNITLNGLWARLWHAGAWFSPIADLPTLASALTLLSSIVVLVALSYQIFRYPATPSGEDHAFAITCLAMLLLSPVAWQHNLTILALPLGVYAAQHLKTAPATTQLLALLSVGFVSLPDVLIAQKLMSFYQPYTIPWYTGMVFALPTVGILLLWALLNPKNIASIADAGQ